MASPHVHPNSLQTDDRLSLLERLPAPTITTSVLSGNAAEVDTRWIRAERLVVLAARSGLASLCGCEWDLKGLLTAFLRPNRPLLAVAVPGSVNCEEEGCIILCVYMCFEQRLEPPDRTRNGPFDVSDVKFVSLCKLHPW